MTALLPEPGLLALVVLTAVVFFNGVWNTAVGSTGGTNFAALAAILGPVAAVPVQGIVEGVSGGYRTWALRGYASRRFLRPFVAGGVVGVVGGLALLGFVAGRPDGVAVAVLNLSVAAFILASTWLPIAGAVGRHRSAPALVGVVTSFLTMFVGGLGAPVGASLEARGEGHKIVIATTTAAVAYHYALRLVAFGIIGFAYARYLPLIVGLTAASLAGTLIGHRVLLRVDPVKTRRLFRAAVTAIAISMVVRVFW